MVKIHPDEFEKYLKRKGLAERTYKEYVRYLGKFGVDRDLNEVTGNAFLDQYNVNNPMVKAFLNALKEYYNKVLHEPVYWEIPKRTGRKESKIPKVLDYNQVTLIGKSMKSTSQHYERDILMLFISFQGGLRVSELLDVKAQSFNWHEWCNDTTKLGKLTVRGKGGKERIVLLPPDIMLTAYNYLNKYRIADEMWFIKGDRWRKILKKHSQTALGKNVNPHLLRHSCATHLLDNGVTLEYIRDFLGHKSIVTTQIYAHTSTKILEGKIEKIWETY